MEPNVAPTAPSGEIDKIQVTGLSSSLRVGDSLSFGSALQTTGEVDTAAIRYSWKLSGMDSLGGLISSDSIAKWIPKEPGQYSLELEVEYQGKTVSALVIFVVIEKEVDNGDALRAEALKNLRARIPGKYAGTVTTPWAGAVPVAVEFREDGTYSAFNTETTGLPALYYGSDEESPERTWSLRDMNADGSGSGNLFILFEPGNTVREDLEDVMLSGDGTKLSMQFMHFGQYGPVEIALSRISDAAFPPRPLPSPSVHSQSFDADRSGWIDTAIVEIEPAPGLSAVYQIVPMTGEGILFNLLNPILLWRDDLPALPVEGPIRIADSGSDLIVLARSRDGSRLSGIVAGTVYWKRSSGGMLENDK
ncbi:MAG: hypothetical protein ABI036_10780 [Fibrobacteria bacterium]